MGSDCISSWSLIIFLLTTTENPCLTRDSSNTADSHCHLISSTCNTKNVFALLNKATSVMIEPRHEKNCLCDMWIKH